MRQRMLPAIATTGLGIALAVLTASPSFAAPGVSERAARAPEPEQCVTIDFEEASVTPLASTGSVPPSIRYRLKVSGMKSASNVQVKLVPLVYVRQPEFWGIEVIGCSSGIGLPVLTPYTVTHDFTGPLGTCGIEVIGATKTQQFDLASCTSLPLAGTSWVLDPASLGVPVPADSPITANFSESTVSGSTSCNLYQAGYKTGTGGAFGVGAISTTKRACDAVTGAAESAFLKRLAASTQFQVTKAELRLLGDGKALLRFTSAASAA